MSDAPRRWIRLDVDWEDSAWLDSLDGTASGCWPRVLCLIKRSGVGGSMKAPDMGVLARRWRVPRSAVESLVAAARSDGALVVEDGIWTVPGWDEYQKPDATAVNRMRKMRAKREGVTPGYDVTDRNPSRDRDVDVDVDGKSTSTPGVVRQKAEIEHTISSLALDAHRVLGLNTWGDELSRQYRDTKRIITTTWVASGIPLDEVHAAIHGLRLMVDRGDIEWLADCKNKPLRGLEVLVSAQALVPGPDGQQLRSLFTAAADAYRSEQTKSTPRKATTGPQRITVDISPGFVA